MIVLYTGRRGAGKTITMIKDAIKFSNNGWRILSNVAIKNVDVELINTEDIVKINKDSSIKDAVLVIDEIQVMFDSRRSSAKENKEFSNFIQQIRKRNIILLCTTQFSGTTDLRIRQHTDILVRPRFNKIYCIVDAIYYDITASEDVFFDEGVFNKRVVFDPRSLFNAYDTNATIT